MHCDENWRELLSERFPERDPNVVSHAWDELRKVFAPGQDIRGVVVARADFGAWLDIGAGFPALLLIPDVAGITPESYRSGDWCPVGSHQQAWIVLFNEMAHQIRVSQRMPHEDGADIDRKS